MAIVSVYDLEGVEHKRESVDARELVAIGWTTEPKPVVADEKPAKKQREPKEVVVAE